MRDLTPVKAASLQGKVTLLQEVGSSYMQM